MWQQFSHPARQAVHRAQRIAVEKRSPTVEAAHLFLATLPASGDEESTVGALLQVSGVTRDEAELYALAALETRDANDDSEPVLSKDAKNVLRIAFQIANHSHQNVINPEHLFIACVAHQRGPHLGETLRPLGLDAARLKQHLGSLRASKTPYKKGNPLNSLTQQSERAIEAAHAAMRTSFCGRISTSHLLLGLLSDENFASVTMLQDIGADLEALKLRAREVVAHDGHIATPQKKFSPGAKRALERAARGAKAANHGFIGTDDLLRALLPQRETWREKLKAGGQIFDSVESLWTAEQVEALRSSHKTASVDVTIQNRQSSQPRNSSLRRFGTLGITGFVAALLWDIYLFNTPHAHNLWIVIVTTIILLLLVVGVAGFCVSLVLRRVPRLISSLLGILFGLFIGAIFGAVLSQVLFSKIL